MNMHNGGPRGFQKQKATFHKGPPHAHTHAAPGPKAAFNLCRFYTKGTTCNNGSNCRFSHDISAAFSFVAHDQPIHSLNVLSSPEGPMVVSGSNDGTIKIWELSKISSQQPQPFQTISTKGKVTHLEVNNNLIVCAVDEPLSSDKLDVTVGTVYLYTAADVPPIAVHRSDEMPYTHSFGEIRSFALLFHDAAKFIVTGGGEGVVKTWKFDPTLNKFEPLSTLEGHVRAVTSVLLHDQLLWTGSMDHTIRVWDVGTGRCAGVLSSMNGGKGHTGAISSLILTPAGPQNEVHVASGGFDQEVKIWKTNGEFICSLSHSAWVTCLCHFQDAQQGVPVLLIGLADGCIAIRSCLSTQLIYIIDSTVLNTRTIWSLVSIGQSCFAAAGEEGSVVIWKVDKAIPEPK